MTRYYRKVEVAVWGDARFRALSPSSPSGQMLWLYLLTGPRTTVFPGLVIGREAVMADDLGWSLEGFREAFGEAFREGLVEASWKAGLVVLRKALIDGQGDPRETSRPESPNVIRHWAKAWDQVPECDLKYQYLRTLGTFAEALGEGFAKAFREAFAKALAHPSPNQGSGIRDQVTGNREEKQRGAPAGASVSGLEIQVDPGKPPKPSRKKPRQLDATQHERAIAAKVLERLGYQNGVAYTNCDTDVTLITKRLREGITEWDLRAVVIYCAEELNGGWKNSERMLGFLRPSTLFGPETIHKYLEPARAYAAKLGPVELTPNPEEAA